MKEYRKEIFWSERDEPNNENCRLVTPQHLDLVRPFINSEANILEYGPGIGRMIDLYSDIISFYDISETYKERLIGRCKESNLKIKDFIIDTSGTIRTDFNDNEFDFVCAFEVLLHSPPNEIKDLLLELSRIGKNVIVITWYEGGQDLSSFFCWTRDYKEMLKELNLTLDHWDESSLNKQVFFIYS